MDAVKALGNTHKTTFILPSQASRRKLCFLNCAKRNPISTPQVNLRSHQPTVLHERVKAEVKTIFIKDVLLSRWYGFSLAIDTCHFPHLLLHCLYLPNRILWLHGKKLS